ncbi:MAG: hypothetical protein IT378_17015 [Sandaracinaceae bacterium]|nr:hypothetical protein [Sandaracinaceae bacterium]
MTTSWRTLAQILLLAGCADSHVGIDGALADGGERFDGHVIDAAADGGQPIDAAGDDGGTPRDAGPIDNCDPQDAAIEPCAALCDGPGSWHWNGHACFYIDCGACRGADCAGPGRYATEAECVTAHARCESTLCRSTGGAWRWWDAECDHYHCGLPRLVLCANPHPVCDCGLGNVFDPNNGCVPGPLCELTAPRTRQALCESSGGTWSGICCDTECGDYCPLACAQPACDCGPGRVFEAEGTGPEVMGRGCVQATRCFERQAGESCGEGAACLNGNLCCANCGGAGCSPYAFCEAPTCDDDPLTDLCGNRLDVP